MDNKLNEKPSLYHILLKKEWSYYTGAVVIAALALSLNAFSGIWGVSGPLSTWGGKVLTLLGVNADSFKGFNGSLAKYNFWTNKPSITDMGLLFGAAIATLLAAEWKIRNIKHWKQALSAIVGGLLIGFGAAIASGCNIGGLFSQLPQFSIAGWLFLLMCFLGAWVGGRLLKFFMPPVSNKRPNRKRLTAAERKRNRNIQIAVGAVLLLLCLVIGFAVSPKYPSVPAFVLIGLGLGYALQRSRFCFTAAYRDPTLTGETKVTRAFILALALSTIGFFGFHAAKFGVDLSKLTPETMPGNPIHLQMIIGSFLFGIGAVLAGGCASGTFVRVGEGYVQNLISLVFFIVGNTIGKIVVPHLSGSFLQAGAVKLYLPTLVGGLVPALIIQLLVLLGLWVLSAWWEDKKKVNA